MNEHDVAKRHYGECLRFDPDDAKCKMLFRQVLPPFACPNEPRPTARLALTERGLSDARAPVNDRRRSVFWLHASISCRRWVPLLIGLLQIKKMDNLKKSANDLMEAGQAREALQDINNALAVDPRHSLFNIELHMMACKAHVALAEGRAAVSACDQVEPIIAHSRRATRRSQWRCRAFRPEVLRRHCVRLTTSCAHGSLRLRCCR